MADNKNKNRNRAVDDAGIRLAPTPIRTSDYHVLPSVRQEFVIAPHIEAQKTPQEEARAEISTSKDFQPRKKDISKKWKRSKRGRNIALGLLMLLLTAFVALPYVLGAASQHPELPFKYVPERFNAIYNLIEAFKATAQLGWKGELVNAIWIGAVPDLILAVGILCLAINLVKSIVGMFIVTKPVRYVPCAVVYCCSVLAILVASLVGAPEIGVARVDIVSDVILSYATSELFSMLVLGVGYLLVSAIINLFNADNSGYIR